MGSDNGKIGHRPPRNKERQKRPPPLLDSRSNGSHATDDASTDRWGHGSRSSRGSRNAHENASVKSSQSSVLVKSDLYKEMSKRHDRRGKSPENPSGSHGWMRVSFLVVVVMIMWVFLYVGKTFPGLISGSLAPLKESGHGVREIGVSNKKGEQIEHEDENVGDEKSNTVTKDEDSDAHLASLASGAGSNLWESVLQTANGVRDDPGVDSTSADSSMTSIARSSEKDDGISTSESSSSTGEATLDGRSSISGTPNDSAASDTSSHIGSATDGSSQLKTSMYLSSDGTTPNGQLLTNSQGTENEDQKSTQIDENGSTISLGMVHDPLENSQELLSQTREAQSKMQAGTINSPGEVQSLNPVIGEGKAVGGLREQEIIQGDNLVDGPDHRPQEVDDLQNSSVKQGMLRGSSVSLQVGAAQSLAADSIPTNLSGSMVDKNGEHVQITSEPAQNNQDESHLESNVLQDGTGGTFNHEIALNTDPLAQQQSDSAMADNMFLQYNQGNGVIAPSNIQLKNDGSEVQELLGESLMSTDIDGVHNAGGNGNFHEANGMQTSDGLLAQSLLQREEGIMFNSESLDNGGGNGLNHEIGTVQMRDGSVAQQQQNGDMMSNDGSLNKGGGEGKALDNYASQIDNGLVAQKQQMLDHQNEDIMSNFGSLQNGAGNGNFQENSSIQMEYGDGSNPLQQQVSQQQDHGMRSKDMSVQNGGGNGVVQETSDMSKGSGSLAQQQVEQRKGGYAAHEMSLPNLDNNKITMENLMGQQKNTGLMSSNILLSNGEDTGNFEHNNDVRTSHGSGMEQQFVLQQQNEGTIANGVSLQNGASHGNFQDNNGIQTDNNDGSQHVLPQRDDIMLSHDMSLQNVGRNGIVREKNDVSTGEGSLAQQQLVRQQNDGYISHDMSLPTLDNNDRSREKPMGQEQNEGVMSSNNRLRNGEGGANFHQDNDLQMSDGSVMQQQLVLKLQNEGTISNDGSLHNDAGNGNGSVMEHQIVLQQQNEGTRSNGGTLQNGAGNGNFQDNTGIETNNDDGLNAQQQQLLQKQDDGMMSDDKSVQIGWGNVVVQENSAMRMGMGDVLMAIEQQVKGGMLTNDPFPHRNAIEVTEQRYGDDKGVDVEELPKQQDPIKDQKFMVVNTNMLSQNGRSTSGGVMNVSNKPSWVGRSKALLSNEPASGRLTGQQQGDGSVSTSLSTGMSNFMQSQNIGTEEVAAQRDLVNEQMQLAQGHRRLEHVTEPESPYENMSPTDLAKYVANHAQYRKLVNFDEGLPFDPSSQVPFFFHIHKSAGSSMKHMLTCMGLTQTRRGSSEECDDKAKSIRVCPLEWGSAVNADASSPEGIERIKKLGLLELNVPNLVVTTSRFYEALSIFTPQHRGRLFVILRDPIERAISKYYYTRVATWERNYNPTISNMTMLEYAHSHHCYDNWVTRRLIHKMNPGTAVTDGDLRLAKEILRQKALVLLTANLEQSSHRMVQFFNWTMNDAHRWCATKYSNSEIVNKNPHPIPSKDSLEWAAIREKNLVDIELYRYALSLYHDQQGPYLYAKFGPLNLPDAVNPERDQNTTPDEEDVQ